MVIPRPILRVDQERIFCSILILVMSFLAGSPALAQTQFSSYISSAPMPVGSGARALGYNGAFTAVADDATAASWNPAGLLHLERPEISVVGSYFNRAESYKAEVPDLTLTGADDSFGGWDLNYLSVVYPFSVFQRNFVVSFSYQRLYDFRRELDFAIQGEGVSQAVRLHQEGGMGTLSPAIAVQVTSWLYLGATVNFWIDELGSSEAFRRSLTRSFPDGREDEIQERFETTSGVNATLGLLARPLKKLTLGASLDLPFQAKLDVYRRASTSPQPGRTVVQEEWENIPLDFPLSVSFGLAWRFSDRLTADLDYSFTDWDGFRTKSNFGAFPGEEVSAITGDHSSVAATHSVRIGAEHLWILRNLLVPLRAGVGYDPEPAGDTSEPYWTAAIGTGLAHDLRRVGLQLDMGYQLRFGLGVQKGALRAIPGAEADVFQHTVMISLIVKYR